MAAFVRDGEEESQDKEVVFITNWEIASEL